MRSVIVDEDHRHSRMFIYLTAGPDPLNACIAGLHRGAEMTKLGTNPQAAAFAQLSLLSVEPMARRVKALRHRNALRIDQMLLRQLHQRRAERLVSTDPGDANRDLDDLDMAR